ncbi:MAG TPA: HypC/HybG/HupF family hydrogenase formation chaperone [Candidatus Anammoximicrobium sp.]|nr:HypC/HybG/HupF family hydrogenase formation chaperone [Candidatus Anammoximicrobium sp.]
MCLGIPGKVVEIHEQDALPMGKVEFGGIVKDVCLAYVPETQVGDYVLVHVGFAISKIDEDEAREVFSYIEQIEQLADLQEPEPPLPVAGTPSAEAVP